MKNLVIENRVVLDKEILELISTSDIKEPFNSSAEYKFVAKYKDRLVGIISYMITELSDGITRIYPRFIHVILHPEFKRSKVAYAFLKETEKILLRDGHNQVMAYIKPEKAFMIELAEKFGYKQYAEDDEGKFLYKDLGG